MAASTRDLQLRELKDTINQLNDRNQELLDLMTRKDAQIEELLQQTKNQQEQIDYLMKKLFGTSSEKIDGIDGQLSLFDEAEQECDFSVPEIEGNDSSDKKNRTKKSHSEQFRGVPVSEVITRLDPGELFCPECGTEMVEVGKEFVRDEFIFIPARGKLIKHYVMTYKCPECTDGKTSEVSSLFRKAEPPLPLLENSFVSPSMMSWTYYQKFALAMPLYRQEQDWKRQGVSISRTTLANWIIRTSDRYLRPLYDHLHEELLKRKFLMADETRVQVLKEKNRSAESDSFMWLFRSGEDGLPPILLYHYTETRAGFNAVSFLKGFSGYLETDGYQGYDMVPDIKRCCCWAHVRRYFFDAVPKGSSLDMSEPAVQALAFIDKLFAVERYSQKRGYNYEQRKAFRLEKAVPLLEAFWRWLDKQKPVKGSRFDKAVNYTRNRRPYLDIYLEDGRCSFSNNLSENAIRPFTVGRKNWLFSDTPKGAVASSIAYTMVELAKANGIDPLKYLTYVLERRPSAGMTGEELERFMPWNEDVARACRNEVE